MRIVSKDRKHFHGTHKGCEIIVEREKPAGDPDVWGGNFYIQVRGKDGCYLYDGYSPAGVNTMAEAKREAVRGACL